MKAKHYAAEQIIKILEQAERSEQTVGAVCREHGIAEATFYHWRKTYGGTSVAEAQRLKELEKENGRLKRLLAERMLEVDALKEIRAKKADGRRTTQDRPRLSAVWMQGFTSSHASEREQTCGGK
jgi:putative transposase